MKTRKSKLNRNVIHAITESIRHKAYATVAAQAAGIGQATFFRWMSEGKEAKPLDEYETREFDFKKLTAEQFQDMLNQPGIQVLEFEASETLSPSYSGKALEITEDFVALDVLKRELWESVKEAEAEAEMDAIRIVENHMEDNWQAAMTYLERRFPERWRRRETTYNEEPPPVDKTVELLKNPEARELAARMEEILATEGKQDEGND